uniref:Uncharacterized protein n=1 Tax=Timema cristinae TaxID=61476 RepID=A0A7R9CWN4_TIMCR|nr:unnamed protein product [Timema cristinae]
MRQVAAKFVPQLLDQDEKDRNNFSRCSSASSLSREVESYTSRASRHRQQGTAFPETQPFMFDPSSFNQTTSSWAPSNQPHLT